MRRWVLWLLPLLVVALALRAGDAYGAVPSASVEAQATCGDVKLNEKGIATRLKNCGKVDPAGDPETVARAVVGTYASRLGLQADGKDLRLLAVQPTSVATHVRFAQTYKGVAVYLGQVLVQYNKAGNVDLIVNETQSALTLDVTPKLAADAALQIANAEVNAGASLRSPARRELVVYADGIAPTLAWHLTLNTAAPLHDWHVMVSATDGKVLAKWDQIRVTKKPETVANSGVKPALKLGSINDGAGLNGLRRPIISALIPLTTATPTATATTAPVTSGTTLTYDPNAVQEMGDLGLRDGNDANTPILESARVQLPINHLAMSSAPYKLRGAYVDVTSTAVTGCSLAYTPGLASETTPVFNYTRDNDRFEEALTYAAVDGVQSWFQGLGISSANNRSQPVNVHCIEADNSYYSDDDGALHFGDGGVDDAEDADIVIHEYGHAVHDNQVPGWGPGRNTEQRAMGEGWGDFLAGMYYVFKGDESLLANYQYCIGEWDATSYNPAQESNPGGGCLRWINGRDEGNGQDIGQYRGTPTQEHDDGRFWSAALTCVYEGMGANLTARDNITRIVLQSHFSQVATTSNNAFENAVDALLLADRNVLGGQHQRLITDCMVSRGLIALPKVTTPTLTYPVGGEVLPPSTTVNITWTTNGAAAGTTYVAEYTAQCRPSGDFFDDIEGGQGGWAVSHASGSQDWRIVDNESHSPTHSWFAPNADTVTDLYLVSPAISISGDSVLAFWHRYNLEGGDSTGYDGGVVEISTNGTTWTDLGPQMTQNGYNRTISTSFDNPIGGRQAFSSNSNGWLETRASLTTYVGQTIRLRFRLATDRSVSQQGWWVDDVLIGTPVSSTWQSIGRSAVDATSLAWTTPAQQGLNYCVRIRGEAEGFEPSAWSQSQPFAIWQGTPPTLTPTRTVVTPTPVVTTPVPVTPTATPTGPTPTRTVTPPPPVTVTPAPPTPTPPAPSCYYMSVMRLYEVLPGGTARRLDNIGNAFTVNAVGRQRSFPDILLYNVPRGAIPASGESIYSALNLFQTTPPLNDARATVSLNLPGGWSFVGATCNNVNGAACMQPASGTSTPQNQVILDFACNAVVEYRFYVQPATSSFMAPPGTNLLKLPEVSPATDSPAKSLFPFAESR